MQQEFPDTEPLVGQIGPAQWQPLPSGASSMPMAGNIVITGREGGNESLETIYANATVSQWQVSDFDWSGDFDEENPLQMHDVTVPLAHTPIWEKMSEKERAEVRRQLQGWHLSQIIHGERASMLCASKIMLSSEDPTEKICAAMQAGDEARHADAYMLMLGKVGSEQQISPSLDRLLYDVLEDSEPGMVALGMQIMVEGLALSFFKTLSAYSQNPLVRQVLPLVIKDEARHFAAGRLSLAKLHSELTAAELARREEYVAEASALLDDYLFADELWEPLGLNQKQCSEMTRQSPVNRTMHRSLFRSIVPAVRGIGLLGKKTEKTFESLGVLDYAAFPMMQE